ncbi:calpain-13 [Ornithorhynchus anatinus]|uniref:calpain-13 n=1 Tax=Ornithorhynchus anatinus TaxID=9258 RepID=UPI0019D432B4|nr:calpain-13 [Ornithorhynchus anatinus]
MAHRQWPPRNYGSRENPQRFKQQDFNTLRDWCLSHGKLFEDDVFPAGVHSVGQQLIRDSNIIVPKWKRPWVSELSRSPAHFILDGTSRFDVQQGILGDCWVLAALGSLTQNPKFLKDIIPVDQSFTQQYAGIFHFRFWQCGQWVDVVVDDRLPVQGQDYLFVRPRQHSNEFWPCLLEKAYAKLHGSYFSLHSGHLSEALVDFTGGVAMWFNVQETPQDLVRRVQEASASGSLMACCTSQGLTGMNTQLANGLVSGHAYTVTGAKRIQYGNGWEAIIRVWNPWGSCEWKGRWSDGSEEWRKCQDPRKNKLYENKEDGEFWISYQDFREHFSTLYICNETPIPLNSEDTPGGKWNLTKYENQRIQGNPIMGGRSSGHGASRKNPLYFISVTEPVEGENVVVTFTIMATRSKSEDVTIPLSFQLFKVDPQFQEKNEGLPPEFFSQFRNPVQGASFKSRRHVTKYFHLPPGTYVVVTFVNQEEREVEFFLRIFQKEQDTHRNSNKFSFRELKDSLPGGSSSENNFQRHTQQDFSIDPSQLQSFLNGEFLKGNSLGSRRNGFTLPECRSIVALLDLQVNGRLDRSEFDQLWKHLVTYQDIFQKVDKKKSGFLLGSDLWKAVHESGFSISDELLARMVLRYGDEAGRISFPDLVCFLLRLKIMAKAFRNLTEDGKGLYLTETQWMNLSMYS